MNSWTAFRVLLLAVVVCFILIGCRGQQASHHLAAVQGEWKFNEVGYMGNLRAISSSEEEYQQLAAIYDAGRKNNMPLMTDITIQGNRITTNVGLLRCRFEVLSANATPGRIDAQANWWEDERDSGDFSVEDIRLDYTDQVLSLTIAGAVDTFPFTR